MELNKRELEAQNRNETFAADQQGVTSGRMASHSILPERSVDQIRPFDTQSHSYSVKGFDAIEWSQDFLWNLEPMTNREDDHSTGRSSQSAFDTFDHRYTSRADEPGQAYGRFGHNCYDE